MGSFIKHKKEKILSVFKTIGLDVNEHSFIEIYKLMYPEDWKLIQERWGLEEQTSPPGKKHPM